MLQSSFIQYTFDVKRQLAQSAMRAHLDDATLELEGSVGLTLRDFEGLAESLHLSPYLKTSLYRKALAYQRQHFPHYALEARGNEPDAVHQGVAPGRILDADQPEGTVVSSGDALLADPALAADPSAAMQAREVARARLFGPPTIFRRTPSGEVHAIRLSAQFVESLRTDEMPDEPQEERVYLDAFLQYWFDEMDNHDAVTRLFRLLRKDASSTYLTRDDFAPLCEAIVNFNPGLRFLANTPEFQLKYAETVIARIFYQVNRSGNERITQSELWNSNFVEVLDRLDKCDDINAIHDYFSYEHFYVIYCRFWELDRDHDGFLDASDLQLYDDCSLTSSIVQRVMSGAGRRFLSPVPDRMSYLDFVVFLISEVDKTSDVSIDYWFRCLDLDGDGVLTAYEIEHFFAEQKSRIENLSQEHIELMDILCQLVDMVKTPEDAAQIRTRLAPALAVLSDSSRADTLAACTSSSGSASAGPCAGVNAAPLTAATPLFLRKDLRECRLAAQFFDTIFNLTKFIQSEQRDPVRIKQYRDTPELTEWDRYAMQCYTRLAEESTTDDAYAWINDDMMPVE